MLTWREKLVTWPTLDGNLTLFQKEKICLSNFLWIKKMVAVKVCIIQNIESYGDFILNILMSHNSLHICWTDKLRKTCSSIEQAHVEEWFKFSFELIKPLATHWQFVNLLQNAQLQAVQSLQMIMIMIIIGNGVVRPDLRVSPWTYICPMLCWWPCARTQGSGQSSLDFLCLWQISV